MKLDGMAASRDLVGEGHESTSKETTIATIEVIVVIVTFLFIPPSFLFPLDFCFGGIDVIMVIYHSGVKHITVVVNKLLIAHQSKE